ncbi:hypothetical protein M2447_001437 [Ereboglobus sp. PH5-10]|uniref:hypothetical protein n=1 Tax=Ereboglobus sp. PH5-10 TaxID=2940629 RepID=UPI002406488F|nr:hypothetical protein [Ereboglobus sp. PH5-10]MDF9827345.1 hypothetical protein [Ereboglobus sp. PH5-10]
MKYFVAFYLIALGGCLTMNAVSLAPPKKSYTSKNEHFVLRVMPGVENLPGRETAIALVFQFNDKTWGFDKKKQYRLINKVAPSFARISDSGEVVTFDDYAKLGGENSVVLYAPDGKLKAQYSLKELMPSYAIEKLKTESVKEMTDAFGLFWYKDSYFYDSDIIIYTNVGGVIAISNSGSVEYTDSKNNKSIKMQSAGKLKPPPSAAN